MVADALQELQRQSQMQGPEAASGLPARVSATRPRAACSVWDNLALNWPDTRAGST
jgi:hypothetical protein